MALALNNLESVDMPLNWNGDIQSWKVVSILFFFKNVPKEFSKKIFMTKNVSIFKISHISSLNFQ